VRNVPGYRHAAGVTVHVDGIGSVTGDVAWGGNWFFLINDHGQIIQASNIQTLTAYATYVKDALVPNGITGADGAEIDHIELFAPSDKPGVNSKNFVLCPGNAYDRSPCGTGTSAKMACLFSDGKLHEGEVWRQESVIGSVFEGTIELDDAGRIIPSITGEAFVTAKAELILDPRDPLRFGIRSA
jgi:4-hydroxyproline epimerase